MATTEDIARSALGALNSDAEFLGACLWVNERYQQLVSRARFRHLRRIAEVIAPGIYSTGTIDTIRGSNLVIGNATAWTPTLIGRHFRAFNNFYCVAEVNNFFELRLETPYAENSVTAGAYKICARFINFSSRTRWIGNVLLMARTRRILDALSIDEMEMRFPGRIISDSTMPLGWCEIGTSTTPQGTEVKQIELYPSSTNDELLYFITWDLPGDIRDPNINVPSAIDPYVLKEGALIDVMRHKAAKAADEGKVEIAAYWRNESRAQETLWERHIQHAILTDKGVDDNTFIAHFSRGPRHTGDVKTAYDDVYARGNRP